MSTRSNKDVKLISVDQILDIAGKVVSRYVFRRAIPSREKDDVVMAIVEKFLKQRNKIEEAFEGKSQKTTYFVAILNRMCCEIIRKESRHWYSISTGDEFNQSAVFSSSAVESEKSFAVDNELKRLDTTMLFFNDEQAKISLFLKCLFDLPYSTEDISAYANKHTKEVQVLLNATDFKLKGDVFETLSRVVNLVEAKDIKGDAVRMWLNKQIDIILNRLNRNGVSNHSKESLAILLEIQQCRN